MARRLFSLIVYNLALPIALLCLLPNAIIKLRRRGGTPKDFLQKTGRYPTRILRKLARLERPIWIHAVSVGETNIAVKLIRQLRTERPEKAIVLSTTTTTAQAVAQQALPEANDRDSDIALIYNPVDFPPTVERALHLIRPSLIILVEAEVWPNLCALARRRHIPIALVNARMSSRSEGRFRRAGALVRPIFSMLQKVCVQEPEDAERFGSVGFRPEAIVSTGSIKFDPPPPPDPDSIAPLRDLVSPLFPNTAKSPVLLGASTFPGEEARIAESFKVLRHQFPDLFLIVVPRHTERAHEAVADLEKLGLKPGLRSELPPPHEFRPDCIVVDTTGELARWQAIATIVVIGKSFLAKGGQNPAEAAALGVPTVLGPRMDNFAALVNHMKQADGTIQIVPPKNELTATLARLLESPERAAEIGANAKAALEPHRGATAKTATEVLSLLP